MPGSQAYLAYPPLQFNEIRSDAYLFELNTYASYIFYKTF
jgi:hypothetical protein